MDLDSLVCQTLDSECQPMAAIDVIVIDFWVNTLIPDRLKDTDTEPHVEQTLGLCRY